MSRHKESAEFLEEKKKKGMVFEAAEKEQFQRGWMDGK